MPVAFAVTTDTCTWRRCETDPTDLERDLQKHPLSTLTRTCGGACFQDSSSPVYSNQSKSAQLSPGCPLLLAYIPIYAPTNPPATGVLNRRPSTASATGCQASG